MAENTYKYLLCVKWSYYNSKFFLILLSFSNCFFKSEKQQGHFYAQFVQTHLFECDSKRFKLSITKWKCTLVKKNIESKILCFDFESPIYYLFTFLFPFCRFYQFVMIKRIWSLVLFWTKIVCYQARYVRLIIDAEQA